MVGGEPGANSKYCASLSISRRSNACCRALIIQVFEVRPALSFVQYASYGTEGCDGATSVVRVRARLSARGGVIQARSIPGRGHEVSNASGAWKGASNATSALRGNIFVFCLSIIFPHPPGLTG